MLNGVQDERATRLPPNHLPLRFPASLPLPHALPHPPCPTFIQLLFFSCSGAGEKGSEPLSSAWHLRSQRPCQLPVSVCGGLELGGGHKWTRIHPPEQKWSHKEKSMEPRRGHTALIGEGDPRLQPRHSPWGPCKWACVKGACSLRIF